MFCIDEKKLQQTRNTSFSQHGCEQLADNGSSLPHLALLAVGKVGNDPDDILGTGSLQGISHNQQLHDSCVDISEKQHIKFMRLR